MISRRRTVDRELLLILITLILLALATQSASQSINLDEATFTRQNASVERAHSALVVSSNPYWAPAHAFRRQPAPVYSDGTVTPARSADQE